MFSKEECHQSNEIFEEIFGLHPFEGEGSEETERAYRSLFCSALYGQEEDFGIRIVRAMLFGYSLNEDSCESIAKFMLLCLRKRAKGAIGTYDRE